MYVDHIHESCKSHSKSAHAATHVNGNNIWTISIIVIISVICICGVIAFIFCICIGGGYAHFKLNRKNISHYV